MPTYTYECCVCGKHTNVTCPIERYKSTVYCEWCGKLADRIFVPPQAPPKKGWPMYSEALAVHPDQVQEAKAFLQKQGVECHFDHWGRPELKNRSHRKQVLKAFGHFDRDGGYGD